MHALPCTFEVFSPRHALRVRALQKSLILAGMCALLHRLKTSPHLAAIPVVMMTGDASKAALLSSMEASAAAFVVKPFTRESLTSKLQAVLSR